MDDIKALKKSLYWFYSIKDMSPREKWKLEKVEERPRTAYDESK